MCPRSVLNETIENKQLIVKVDYHSIIGQGAFGTVYNCTYSRPGNQNPGIQAVVKVQAIRKQGESNQRENTINALMGYEIGSFEHNGQSFTVMPDLGKPIPTHLKTNLSLRSHLLQMNAFIDEERIASSLFDSEEVIASDDAFLEPTPEGLVSANDNSPLLEPELEPVANLDTHGLEVVDTSQVYFEIAPEPEPKAHSLEVVDTSQAYFEIEPDPEPETISLEVIDTSQDPVERDPDPSSLKTQRASETEINPEYFERSLEDEATPPRAFSSKTKLNIQSEAAIENMADIIGLLVKINQSVMRLHQMGIVHLDIKPANLLFDAENDKVNIIDFGHSQFLADKSPKDFIGTAAFMAPELAKKELHGEFTVHQDTYSLGKTFVYLIQNHLTALNKEAVYQGLPDDADDYSLLGRFCLKEATQLNNIEFNNPNKNQKIQAMNDLLKMIKAMLQSSPNERLDLSEVDKQLMSIYINLSRANQNKLSLTPEKIEVEEYPPTITQLLQNIEASPNNTVKSEYSKTSLDKPSGGLFGLMQKARSELQSNDLSSIANTLVEHIKSISRDPTLEANEQNQMIIDFMQKFIEENFPTTDLTREAIAMKGKLQEARKFFADTLNFPEKSSTMKLKS